MAKEGRLSFHNHCLQLIGEDDDDDIKNYDDADDDDRYEEKGNVNVIATFFIKAQ